MFECSKKEGPRGVSSTATHQLERWPAQVERGAKGCVVQGLHWLLALMACLVMSIK